MKPISIDNWQLGYEFQLQKTAAPIGWFARKVHTLGSYARKNLSPEAYNTVKNTLHNVNEKRRQVSKVWNSKPMRVAKAGASVGVPLFYTMSDADTYADNYMDKHVQKRNAEMAGEAGRGPGSIVRQGTPPTWY